MQCLQLYIIYIKCPTLTTKTYGILEGVSKQSADPRNSTAPGPRSLVLKFLDPPVKAVQFCTSYAEEGCKQHQVYRPCCTDEPMNFL